MLLTANMRLNFRNWDVSRSDAPNFLVTSFKREAACLFPKGQNVNMKADCKRRINPRQWKNKAEGTGNIIDYIFPNSMDCLPAQTLSWKEIFHLHLNNYFLVYMKTVNHKISSKNSYIQKNRICIYSLKRQYDQMKALRDQLYSNMKCISQRQKILQYPAQMSFKYFHSLNKVSCSVTYAPIYHILYQLFPLLKGKFPLWQSSIIFFLVSFQNWHRVGTNKYLLNETLDFEKQ